MRHLIHQQLADLRFIILGLTLAGLPYSAWSAELQSNQDTISSITHIRTLAASCAACHGEQGNSVGITPSLAGLDKGYFVTQMLAFKDGSRPATVMHRHAKGLQAEEIQALAEYFSLQKRVTATPAPAQTLKANHAD
jgi:cytochrome subunit of sulfide dehydrogenase